MCGILGGNDRSWDYEAALETLKHRGPNARKITRFSDFTLGFARLSIIDLSESAMQPMASRDQKVSVVFNGEIYGFGKLRKQLERKGVPFATSSDTEVILNAYLCWGDRFVDHLDGMFAIAVYDMRSFQVKLYRDRSGIKPLYYYENGRHFAFASEIKAIVRLSEKLDLRIDHTAVYDFLTYIYIPEPKTMYQKIRTVPPGGYLVYDVRARRMLAKKYYWKLQPNERQGMTRKPEEIRENLRELIRETVAEQLVADVPVGTMLSGGIDSSILTYEASLQKPNIMAFTMGFAEEPYNEMHFAELMAERCSVIHKKQVMCKNDFLQLQNHLKTWFDQPFADTSAYPAYMVSKLARESVTVALCGDGGDELFAGYKRYIHYQQCMEGRRGKGSTCLSNLYERYLRKSDANVNVEKERFILDDVAIYYWVLGYNQRRDRKLEKRELSIPKDYDDYWPLRKHYIADLPPVTRAQYMDYYTYLPGDVLQKEDRVSMAASLETRVPFLSRRLIEFAFGLTQEERCSGGLKSLLKDTYRNMIPDSLLDREKMGFAMPMNYLNPRFTLQQGIYRRFWSELADSRRDMR